MKYIIKKADSGKRLDVFCVRKLENKTRSHIQKAILAGLVLVNGKTKNTHYFLKAGDVISIEKEKRKKKEAEAIVGNKRDAARSKTFKIIFANDEFLVINKPAGLIVHSAEHIKEVTLADLLLKKYPELKEAGEDDNRPGIVHRLDKDASGLMVVARTQKSFANLKKQFSSRQAKKEYLALVHGKIKKDEGEIDFPIKRSAAGNRQAAVPESYDDKKEKARKAKTYFKAIKKFVNYTLLSLKTKTGRKHQIRVHLAAYGHPIVGDSLYHTKKTKELNKKLNLGRIFLAAVKLGFKDLSGKKYEFEIKLPKKLADFLKSLK